MAYDDQRARELLRRVDPDPPLGQLSAAMVEYEALLHAAVRLFLLYGHKAGVRTGNIETWNFELGDFRVLMRNRHEAFGRGELRQSNNETGGPTRPLDVRVVRLAWDRAEQRWYPADPSLGSALDALVNGLLRVMRAV